jgi:DNA-binding TFAR19-related protein (PDSD5 family)
MTIMITIQSEVIMSRQNEWQKGKKAEGFKLIKPLITPEAQAALERLKATRKTMQQVVNDALIYMDIMERNNEKLN